MFAAMIRFLPRPGFKAAEALLLSRAMSLSPKHVLSGARWDYSIICPLQGDGTHLSTVLKAEVLPRDQTTEIPKW
jgi:hypothetical protein